MNAVLVWIFGLSLLVWVGNFVLFHDALSAPETTVLVGAVAAVVIIARTLWRRFRPKAR